jgi:hypothetical protein
MSALTAKMQFSHDRFNAIDGLPQPGGQSLKKPLHFTTHVEGALAERKLLREWVERVVRFPDWTKPDASDRSVELRFGVIAERDGRIMRVPVVETDREIRILSAFLDRRAKRPGSQ